MANYQELYLLLFNAVTDSIAALDRDNYGLAKEMLMEAQQKCEELYVEHSDGT